MIKNIYTPNDYKDLASDSKMIQAAVDEAAKYGSQVVIPRVNERTGECIWNIGECINLHTGSYVVLDNCHLRLEDDTHIHFFQNSTCLKEEWWKPEHRQYDIQIIGQGNAVLDGGNHNGVFESHFAEYDDRGNLIRTINYKGLGTSRINIGIDFKNAERTTVKGLRFINQRYWGLCYEICSYGHVADLNFESYGREIPNQDGVDIRVGCNNFLIENIYGSTGDDAVALTNFGTTYGCDFLTKDTGLDIDIHDIIIKNIRSYMADNCDIIRILNRGGTQMYNVQISNVVDITPEGSTDRPLAAIRIGDLTGYSKRLNYPGEIRNITIRDVVTRGRFGLYIANSLVDSTIENVMFTSECGIGVYFNGCEIENVFMDKITYNINAKAPESDIGYECGFHHVDIEELDAFRFDNGCSAKNLNINNVVSGKNLSHVFKSDKEIEINAHNIVMLDENTKLSKNVTIK